MKEKLAVPQNLNQDPYPCLVTSAPNGAFWLRALEEANLDVERALILGDGCGGDYPDDLAMRGVLQLWNGEQIILDVDYSASWDEIFKVMVKPLAPLCLWEVV